MEPPCTLCDGLGMRIIERPDGSRAARDCDCRAQRRRQRTLERTRIPRRYEHCTLENFDWDFRSATTSLRQAHMRACEFVHGYRSGTTGTGLLFTGGLGVGKTHLAVSILQALSLESKATGLFYDYRELLKQIQNSYNRQVEATEHEILAPVFEAEILVLDELGAAKPTEWVWDTVAHILNTRYNNRRTTIITTNYPNAATLQGPKREEGKSVREESLGDRITERMRSRLMEMCVIVDMHGADFRQGVKRAQLDHAE